ncbi:RecQ family ATP-dependent DNA helicase, partial [Singulisphaera rosea]
MSDLDDARRLLRQTFGFDDFREGQERVVASLLEGRSALAVFPTGGGKSLCYQLPALILEGLTVVVSPLIALMKDQIDFLERHGIAAARLDSSLDAVEARQVLSAVRGGGLKLLYVSPERLAGGRFLQTLAGRKVSLLAVDEAHCISEWGHNFRPEYMKLARLAREIKAERVLALTATATPDVARDIARAFEIGDRDVVITGFHRPNLELHATPCRADERRRELLERMK